MVVEGATVDVTLRIGLVAVVGALSAIAARQLRQPTVVGFLAGGLVAGPLLGVLREEEAVEVLGGMGIALLLFLVGIDLSFSEVRAVGPPAIVAGLGQLAGSAAGGYLLARVLGFGMEHALFLAIALAFSSTVVVVKILMDLGELRQTHGRLAVGIFLVQDVVVVLILSILPVLGEAGTHPGPEVLATEGGLAIARTLLLAGVALLAARTILPFVFRRIAPGGGGLLLLMGLMWLFAAVAATELLGVSVEIGAFLAGLSLGQLPYAQELRRRLRPLLDFFLALFFVGLAAGVELGVALSLALPAIAFSLFVIVGNAVVLTLVLGGMRFPRETSFRTGITVGQVSEFSIVLAALALAQGLIDETIRDFVILVTMLTIAVSSLLIWHSKRIHGWLERSRIYRALPDGDRGVAAHPPEREGHILMLGWDSLAPAIARRLIDAGHEVVVVATRERLPDAPEGVHVAYGEPTDLHAMEAAGLRDARLVVSNLAEPGVLHVLLLHHPNAPPVVARAEDQTAAQELERSGVLAVVPKHLVAQAALERLQEVGAVG